MSVSQTVTKKNNQVFSYARFSTVKACGPVRANTASPVEEIVFLVNDRYYDGNWKYRYFLYIFNIASSSWRAGEYSLNLDAFMAIK